MCHYSYRYYKNATKLNTLLVSACAALLDKNTPTNARAVVSVLSRSSSCMQTKKVLKMAKRQHVLMEMWLAVPKKSKQVIIYVVCKQNVYFI